MPATTDIIDVLGDIAYPDLTKRQLEVLDFIRDYTKERGFAPSIKDICAGLHIASTNGVVEHLDSLERKSYIQRSPRTARSIRVLARPEGGVND